MTRKETLYNQKHELQNQLRALRGQETIEMPAGYHYTKALKDTREYELKDEIERLQSAIQAQEKENEVKARTEEFYSTPEGQAYKDSLIHQREDCYAAQEKATEEQLHRLNAIITKALGSRWAVKNMSTTSVEFGKLRADQKDYTFGQDIQIWADPHHFGEGERFEANIGTTGGFDLQSENPDSRLEYYIDLGKLLNDAETLQSIKEAVFSYNDQIQAGRETYQALQKKLANPLGL